MKLARKLTIGLVLGITLVMAGNAILQVRREGRLFDLDSRHDQHAVARVLHAAVKAVWKTDGKSAARHLIADTNRDNPDLTMRWVSLEPGTPSEDAPIVPRALLGELLAGHEMVTTTSVSPGDDRRVTYAPLMIDGQQRGAIEISESLRPERGFIHTTELQVLVTTIVMVLLGAAIALGLGFWFVGRPMQALYQKARRVGEGDFSGPLDIRQHDEIADLAMELNAMCDRLEDANHQLATATEARIAALEQLRHADRLKTVGQLASGVAHELGTPLNVVSGRAKMIVQRMVDGDAVQDSARIIVEQAARITAIIRQLLDFSRRRGPSLGPGDLRPLANRTIELLASLARKRGVAITVEAPDEAVIAQIDPSQIQQVLANLVVNAVQAMPSGGRLTLRLGRRHATPPSDVDGPSGEYATVTVEDQGVGIAPEHLPRIFEPFFTTKDVGEGTGLGLSVAYGIVREHGGWIDVESRPGKGSRFTCFLRLAAEVPLREALA
jgi:two-component system, NtrC family, sensor kinase